MPLIISMMPALSWSLIKVSQLRYVTYCWWYEFPTFQALKQLSGLLSSFAGSLSSTKAFCGVSQALTMGLTATCIEWMSVSLRKQTFSFLVTLSRMMSFHRPLFIFLNQLHLRLVAYVSRLMAPSPSLVRFQVYPILADPVTFASEYKWVYIVLDFF